MSVQNYLAFDFGAQSARAIHGKLDAGKLKISEVYRFVTGGIKVGYTLRWDILRFFEEIKTACKRFTSKTNEELLGIGIDSWGVDFVLLDERGELVSKPYHYRDNRTNNIYEDAFKVVPKAEIYRTTGIQFMQINSLFQLFSMVRDKDPDLQKTKTFLHIADFFHYLLTKRVACEYTLATTSQLYDLEKYDWSFDLIKKLGLNPSIFPEIIPHSTVLGPLLPKIADEVGIKGASVITPATHDTGAAIAAIPATHKDFVYISSGTWSLMGAELANPLVSEESLVNNFTNEGGIFGTIRFLKNISGLWILSECKKIWDSDGSQTTYAQLNEDASQMKPFQFFIDPDNPVFLNPENMIEAIRQFCKSTKQSIPHSRGELVRCILESLAMKYKHVYKMLKNLLKKPFKTLHIIGGGSQNRLLSQFAANSTGLEVKTGPVEATAIGNILTQAVSQNKRIDLFDLRKIVINSFDIQTLSPQDTSEWNEVYKRFVKITSL
ncbi:MAG: rhamnulokinase [Candidatus Helarchaeota archaeon]|nr:rhamnulokinase [Candidatus Helarchaeota archaeon]